MCHLKWCVNYNSCDSLLDNHTLFNSYHTTLSSRTSIDYISGYSSIVTSSHSEFKCNPLHKGQAWQLDCIYPLPGYIYPLPLAHTIVLNHFNWVPMELLPNITSSHSNDSTQFPQPKRLPQRVSITLDLAGHPPDHNSFSICSTHSYTIPVVSSHSYSFIHLVVTCINKLQGPIITS